MLCKYWEGTTHVDIGGNVEFLMEDSAEEIQNRLLKIMNNPEEFERMKKAAEGQGKQEFSYRQISRKSIGL